MRQTCGTPNVLISIVFKAVDLLFPELLLQFLLCPLDVTNITTTANAETARSDQHLSRLNALSEQELVLEEAAFKDGSSE